MLNLSTLLHLRIPFSFFLMPVYMFALASSREADILRGALIFIILHLLLYPASNGYNSYYDRDEQSIGGLKNPPPVSKNLYRTALGFDFFALILGLFISWKFSAMLLIYGLVSKAYSHPSIRLKKYPWLGWIITGFFQGFFTFIMVFYGITGCSLTDLGQPSVLIPAGLTSLLLWGSYPMTQVYQHEEDRKRGDISLSLKLGIKGTFIFTAAVFLVADMAFLLYFHSYYELEIVILFQLSLMPVLFYFGIWYLRVLRDENKADFRHTMNLNFISAVCMNGFFLILALKTVHFI